MMVRCMSWANRRRFSQKIEISNFNLRKSKAALLKYIFCLCCCTQTTKREKETMYKMTINNCCPFFRLGKQHGIFNCSQAASPCLLYLKRRRAIIGNLNRLFKQKEKNFYIQKYNVILFVGGDFDWPRRRTTLMAAKPTFHVVRGLPWGDIILPI